MKNTFIKRENVNAKIRSILIPKEAALFINNAHYIMALISGGAAPRVNETLNAQLGGPVGVDHFTSLYKELQGIEFDFKGEKKGGIITGRCTLLNHLTDGSSHLTIYPETTF